MYPAEYSTVYDSPQLICAVNREMTGAGLGAEFQGQYIQFTQPHAHFLHCNLLHFTPPKHQYRLDDRIQPVGEVQARPRLQRGRGRVNQHEEPWGLQATQDVQGQGTDHVAWILQIRSWK